MKKTIYSQLSKIFCARVVELRTKAKLTQRGLAKIVGREYSFISRIEQGERRVDLIEFYQLCKSCGVDPVKEVQGLMKAFIEAAE